MKIINISIVFIACFTALELIALVLVGLHGHFNIKDNGYLLSMLAAGILLLSGFFKLKNPLSNRMTFLLKLFSILSYIYAIILDKPMFFNFTTSIIYGIKFVGVILTVISILYYVKINYLLKNN